MLGTDSCTTVVIANCPTSNLDIGGVVLKTLKSAQRAAALPDVRHGRPHRAVSATSLGNQILNCEPSDCTSRQVQHCATITCAHNNEIPLDAPPFGRLLRLVTLHNRTVVRLAAGAIVISDRPSFHKPQQTSHVFSPAYAVNVIALRCCRDAESDSWSWVATR